MTCSADRRRLEILIGLSLVIFWVYWVFRPSLQNLFTNCDDVSYLLEDPSIRNLSWNGLYRIFTDFRTDIYRPLVTLSFAVEYFLFGLNPLAYHTTNLLLYLADCVLVFWFVERVSKNHRVALLTALLFAVHPAHVESVAWILERKDMLYSPFFLLSLIGYLNYLDHDRQKKLLWLSLLSFAFSILSKPMAMSLPVLLFLLDRMRNRRITPAVVLEKWPFFLLLALALAPSVFFQSSVVAPAGQNPPDMSSMFLSGIDTLAFYLTQTFFPLRVSFLYDFSQRPGTWLAPYPVLSVLTCLAALFSIGFFAGRSKKALFGSLFFGITLLPALPLAAGRAVVADRFLLVASVGILYLFAEAIGRMARQGSFFIRAALVVFLVLLVGFWSVLSWQQCHVWHDGFSLWSDTIKKFPHRIPAAYLGLGEEYNFAKQYDRAIACYDEALALSPGASEIYVNRGQSYFLKGEPDKAVMDFDRAIALKPVDFKAYNNRGAVFSSAGQWEEAISDFTKAISLKPTARAYYNRGFAYKGRGDFEKALFDFNRALQINDWLFQAYVQKAAVLESIGREQEARQTYQELIRHAPSEELEAVQLAKQKLAGGP